MAKKPVTDEEMMAEPGQIVICRINRRTYQVREILTTGRGDGHRDWTAGPNTMLPPERAYITGHPFDPLTGKMLKNTVHCLETAWEHWVPPKKSTPKRRGKRA